MDEPALRVWMQEPVTPAARHIERPGRWVAERRLALAARSRSGALARRRRARRRARPGARRLEIATDLLCGLDSGVWCADGNPAEARRGPARRGRPRAQLHLGAAAGAHRAARQRARGARAGERPAGGAAGRAALRRGARRQLAARHPRRAEPHAPRRPRASRAARARAAARAWSLELDGIAQAIPAGHRLRLALSPAYWPWLWPAPEPVTLAVAHRGQPLVLPVRSRAPRTSELRPFEEPEGARPRGRDGRAGRGRRTLDARLRQRAHRADLRLGHRRPLPDRRGRPDRRLLGLDHLLDRARRPAVRRGALRRPPPSSAATAGSRAPRSAR